MNRSAAASGTAPASGAEVGFARPGGRDTRILFATPEVAPLAKTGGLADVSAALPKALTEIGIDVVTLMPGYPAALEAAEAKQAGIPLGDFGGLGETNLVVGRTPDTGLPLWLIDCPGLFRRSGGLYTDTDGQDWADNGLRFALLGHAVARLALAEGAPGWRPNLVHVNDWHLGLAPALLAARQGPRPPCLLTIHNLAFQGVFPPSLFPRLGLPAAWFMADGVEYYGQVSFLKAGIRFADALTTVSPTYAREILTPEFGCGLDGLLRSRASGPVGILNGIDCDGWDPGDPLRVPFPFGAHDLSGKRGCKAALQQELGLAQDGEAPVIAYVSRLTEQKMADVLPAIVPVIAEKDAQLVICGEGDRTIEHALRALETAQPQQVAVRIGYQEGLARRIRAGADMLAAPSRFEPCGLTQMYAMHFGTIPIVRAVGGLADTVSGHDERACPTRSDATGFVFAGATADDLCGAIRRACDLYRQPLAWRAMQVRAMNRDFHWRSSAERYVSLYADLLLAGGEEARSTGT